MKLLLATITIFYFSLLTTFAQSLSPNLAEKIVGEYSLKTLNVNGKHIDKLLPRKFVVRTTPNLNEAEFFLAYYTSTSEESLELAHGIDKLEEKGRAIYAYFKGEQVAIFRNNKVFYKQGSLYHFKGRKCKEQKSKNSLIPVI